MIGAGPRGAMRVAIASGKGGTGKTTLSVNLARVFGAPVQLLDCDVEEPNAHLFLTGVPRRRETITVPVPQVDESRCDACGECGSFCQYHAIVPLDTFPMVFPELCHGCGGCVEVCPRDAIRESKRRIGVVEILESDSIRLVWGCLDVGVSMAPPLVRAVKRFIDDGTPAILDAPPGTTCPMVTTLRGADVVILVTEPTPFGLHDLSLAVDVVRKLGMPVGVVVNRVGIGDDRIHAFCKSRDIPILLEIPDDRRIAEAYSRGALVVDALPEYRERFERLASQVVEWTENARGIGERTVSEG